MLVLGDGDRLEEAEVSLLRRQGDDVIIRAAALYGREVVVARSAVLGEGIRVNPLRPDADGARSEAPDTITLEPERRARLIAFVEGSRFKLVETLAERIAEMLLDEFKIPWIKVVLNKPGAVRGSKGVGVVIERSRQG